ncbi:hypothetical protein V5R04_03350 [Jonesiaceae bacterium BS-20]|uniref:Uncharacterized protein n=1 Tax=Jonesiaceae bacterium BS-20 TaxID=3120821 RepID=A0AAU7DYI1_9MICO
MLGKSGRESGAHARLAAELGNWSANDNDLLDLGAQSVMLATIAEIDGISAVVHIGHPAQPLPELERLLLSAPGTLMLTSAVAVESQWTLVYRGKEHSGVVIVDEAGMRDTRYALRSLGLTPHVVQTPMSIEARVELAGEFDALVVERDQIPAGYVAHPDSDRLKELPVIWYGLLETVSELPQFQDPAQVWLAFGPEQDHRGSLQSILQVFADHNVDLQHLRSQRSTESSHVFLSSFGLDGAQSLRNLVTDLESRGVQNRILAIFDGQHFVPGPDALEPVWSRQLSAEQSA